MEDISVYFSSVQGTLSRLNPDEVRVIRDLLFRAWMEQRAVFIIGNGGSAATASHMMNDLNKGAAVPGQPRFRALALTDNVPLLTAWANDTAYERVFSEQLLNFARPGDLLVAISGSGNSPNILDAVQTARTIGCRTVGLTGFAGGKLKALVDSCLIVPSDSMETIEDVHLIVEHCLCLSLRRRIAGQGAEGSAASPAVAVGS